MRWSLPCLLAATMLTPSHLLATEVEIHYRDGQRYYGDLISQDADVVSITWKQWTRGGMVEAPLTLHRDRIVEIENADSLPQLYEKHRKAAGSSYAGQYALSRWCFERGLTEQALRHAQRLYDDNPDDDVVRELFATYGYVLDQGKWVKEADYAKAHGLVIFEGRLLTPEQVAARRADSRAALALQEAVSHHHSLESLLANAQRRVKELQDRMTALKKQEAQEKSALQQQANPNGNGRRWQGGQNTQQQPTAQQTQAQADLAALEQDYQGHIDELKKSIDYNQKELTEDQTNLTADEAVVAAAQKAATDAHAAWLATLPPEERAKEDPASASTSSASIAHPADAAGTPAKSAAGTDTH